MRTTEKASRYDNLDKMSTMEILSAMNSEDRSVPEAVAECMPQIEALVEAIVERIPKGGRVIYIGAGTSGRLGIVDASEIPPTYGVKGKFIGIIAGGDVAIRNAVEGAEDDVQQGWKDIAAYDPCPEDVVIGITASGVTPYVIGAVKAAAESGLLTGCITSNEGSPLEQCVSLPVVCVTGPEFVTGSTRMKSGTALKLILNMISTSVMIRLGHVRGSRMVDMELTNSKLVDRGTRMIMEEAGIEDYEYAKGLLLKYGHVREAVDAFRTERSTNC